MRMIFRVTGFLIHVGQVSKYVIQANQVSCMQRADLHAGTELHGAVDVRGACNVVCIDADSLVDFRNQNTVDNKACAFVYNDRALVTLGNDVMNGINDCIVCADGTGNFNQLHDVRRVEEMYAENAGSTLRDSTGNFRDRQGRGVGADDAVFIQNGIQLLHQVSLCLQLFVDALQNEVRACGIRDHVGHGQLVQRSILSFRGQLALFNTDGKIGNDTVQSVVAVITVDVNQGDIKTGL